MYYNVNCFSLSIRAGKSLSKALILASNNPKYDERLAVELQVQKLFSTSNCSEFQNKKSHLYKTMLCRIDVLSMYIICRTISCSILG